MSEDEVRLQAHLDDYPDDVTSRLILADLLEEWGQDEAAQCQRWLAEQKLWPDSNLKAFSLTGWHWWCTPDRPHKHRAHAVLPAHVQVHMPRGEWLYSTRVEAEKALALALARVHSAPVRGQRPSHVA